MDIYRLASDLGGSAAEVEIPAFARILFIQADVLIRHFCLLVDSADGDVRLKKIIISITIIIIITSS